MPNLIVCELPGGQQIVTTPQDCADQQGTIVDENYLGSSTDGLIPYKLPSGKVVVGTYANLLADKGTPSEGTDLADTAPSDRVSTQRFVCKLPSGLGVVETYAESQKDGAAVVAKVLDGAAAAARSQRKQTTSRASTNVEAEIDRVLSKVIEEGGKPGVEDALRLARKLWILSQGR
jgi:hypothetical protein